MTFLVVNPYWAEVQAMPAMKTLRTGAHLSVGMPAKPAWPGENSSVVGGTLPGIGMAGGSDG